MANQKPPANRRHPRHKPPHGKPPHGKPGAPAGAGHAPAVEQPMMRRRLALLGLRLPAVKAGPHQYVPVVVHGGLAYVSGQLPWQDGRIDPAGKVGGPVSLEQAQAAARNCALHGLSWLNHDLAGGLDEVERVVKLTGFVASAPGFHDQPSVIDAASELLLKLFGAGGQHARSAIGVAELPRNAPVEIEFIFALKRRPGPGQHSRRPSLPVIEKRS